MSDNLRLINNDLVFSMPIVDATDIRVDSTLQDQGMYISVQRLSDDKWWDGDSWEDIEPGSLLECFEEEDTGVYHYNLNDAYDDLSGENIYRIRLNAVGVVDTDYYIEANVIPKADMLAIDSSFKQARKLKRGLKGTVYGKVITGMSNTQFRAQLFDVGSTAKIDVYKNRVITFIEDENVAPADEAESVMIRNYSGATGIFTVSTMVTIPAIGDEFMIT